MDEERRGWAVGRVAWGGVYGLALVIGACGSMGDVEPGLERWTAEPELRVGAADDSAYGLGQVIGLAIAPAGEMLVSEWQEGAIRVFDPQGRFLRRFGRRGSGPGESSQALAVGVAGDTVFVADPMLDRLHLYTIHGELLETVVPRAEPLSEHLGAPHPSQPLADGTLLGQPSIRSHLIDDGTVSEMPVVRMTRTGEILDTLLMWPLTNTQLSISYGRGGMYTRQPVTDQPLFSVTADGGSIIVVLRPAPTSAGTSSFRVSRTSIGGGTLFSREYPYRPTPLPEAFGDSVVAAMAEHIAGSGRASLREAEEAVRNALFLPAFRPPVSALQAGLDGTIWLRREDGDGPDADWIVLDASGEPTARVALPGNLRVFAADREHVWGVEKDALDVDYVVRFRIQRS